MNCLTRALEYIEEHIGEDITESKIAEYSYCSVSSLQKLFRAMFDYNIKEYISKRRLTLAARELINSDQAIIDIAYKYGYHSPEYFCRAFRKLWKQTPSAYRKKGIYTDIFPRMAIDSDDTTSECYRNNINLYDLIREYPESPVICFDLTGLTKINEISRKAGDAAIMETVNRINAVRLPEMPLFRLGGDEFALIALGQSHTYCKKVLRYIEEKNQISIIWEGHQIPMKIQIWIGDHISAGTVKDVTQTMLEHVRLVGKKVCS